MYDSSVDIGLPGIFLLLRKMLRRTLSDFSIYCASYGLPGRKPFLPPVCDRLLLGLPPAHLQATFPFSVSWLTRNPEATKCSGEVPEKAARMTLFAGCMKFHTSLPRSAWNSTPQKCILVHLLRGQHPRVDLFSSLLYWRADENSKRECRGKTSQGLRSSWVTGQLRLRKLKDQAAEIFRTVTNGQEGRPAWHWSQDFTWLSLVEEPKSGQIVVAYHVGEVSKP